MEIRFTFDQLQDMKQCVGIGTIQGLPMMYRNSFELDAAGSKSWDELVEWGFARKLTCPDTSTCYQLTDKGIRLMEILFDVKKKE